MTDGSPKNKHSWPALQNEKLHVGWDDSSAVQSSSHVHTQEDDHKEPNDAQTISEIKTGFLSAST